MNIILVIYFLFNLTYTKENDSCLVCTSNLSDNATYGVYSWNLTEKFIINYFEHLKVFGYSIKLAEIFITSVRENGILSSNVKGHWKIKKHDNHEIIIIEHCADFENLLLKEEDSDPILKEELEE